MKIKHGLVLTLIFIPLCIGLRIMQFYFAIDKDGYYIQNSPSLLVRGLIYSVYGLYILFAISILPILFSMKNERQLTADDILGTTLMKVLFILLSLSIITQSGAEFGALLYRNSIPYAPILGLGAAVAFALIASNFGKKPTNGVIIMAVFPPLYMMVRLFIFFFDSFKYIKISENKFDILSLCAISISLAFISGILGGAKVMRNRLGPMLMFLCVFTSVSAVARLILIIPGRIEFESLSELADALSQLLLFCLSFIMLTRILYIKPITKTPVSPCPEQEDGLRLFISEIPESLDDISLPDDLSAPYKSETPESLDDLSSPDDLSAPYKTEQTDRGQADNG